jgi:hypothetical protein
MIQSYARSYRPPIPVLDIALSFPDSDDWHGTYTAIIDSGADFTIVPLANLQPLNIPILRPATLSSQWPDRRAVNVYEVDLRIGSLFLPAIEVAGDLHSNEIILGCNVLNYLIFI